MEKPVLSKLYVRNYSELYEYLNNSLKKIKPLEGEDFKLFMKKKITSAYQVIESELNKLLEALVLIQNAGDFYRELFKVYTGSTVEEYIVDVKKRIKLARNIYKWAIQELSSLDSKRKRKIVLTFRAGIGRLLSIYKRMDKRVVLVKEYLKEVSKMPDTRGDYIVVLAGLPQVGKSTLLSKLTSAKPEIGSYPFTTKTLIAGHLVVEPYGRIVIIDSPGILDTPIEEKNIIEYKAILALKHLADHVVYLFAYTPSFYYTLQEQLNVYESVKRLLGDKPITIVFNKVDLLSKTELEEYMGEIESKTGIKPIPVSALTGYNLDEIRQLLVSYLKEKKKLQ